MVLEKKKRGRRTTSPAPLCCTSCNCPVRRRRHRVTRNRALILGGEAAQGPAHIAFAKALERAVAQLSHALAGHAEHRADLLERVLAPTFEAEVQAEHLRVTRRQRAEC